MKNKRKIKNISILLNKYWNGFTSIREEKIIKRFFRENNLDIPWQESEWFKLLSEFQPEANIIDFEIFKKPIAKNKFKIIKPIAFIKYAAIIVLAISIWFGYSYNKKRNEEKNMVILSQKVETDLLFISRSLNDGIKNLKNAQDGIIDKH